MAAFCGFIVTSLACPCNQLRLWFRPVHHHKPAFASKVSFLVQQQVDHFRRLILLQPRPRGVTCLFQQSSCAFHCFLAVAASSGLKCAVPIPHSHTDFPYLHLHDTLKSFGVLWLQNSSSTLWPFLPPQFLSSSDRQLGSLSGDLLALREVSSRQWVPRGVQACHALPRTS